MKTLIIALTLSSIVACTTMEYVPVKLELPPKPIVPKLSDKAIECVDQPTYSTLVHRDLAYQFYIGRLEATIKSTWNNEDDAR